MPTSRPTTWSVRSPEDLGRALSGVRRSRGLTQKEVAEQVCIGRSYLAELETAAASPLAIERTLRVFRRLGATVTVTLPGDEPGKAHH